MRDDRIAFLPSSPLYRDLRARVDAYFAERGLAPSGGWRITLKSAVLASFSLAVYLLFLLGGGSATEALLYGTGIGLGVAGLGFCVQHDASHGAYSARPGVNRLLARVLDLLGGSSHVWRTKHNVIHHTYTNLVGVDQDLEAGVFARFAPGQRRRPIHRFQHVYMWPLYGLLTVKWMWVDDFVNVATGKLGPKDLPRPRGWEWVGFLGGKVLAFGWLLVLPIAFHGLWIGLLFHLTGHVVAGVTMATVFQLAHCVEEAEFPPVPTPEGERVEWAVHQLRTTVDFARGNPVLTWLLGGLNFQAVHHLFPRVSHVHYPALSRIVAEVCTEHGVRYRSNPSFVRAVLSHARWLRRMGAPVPPGVAPAAAAG